MTNSADDLARAVDHLRRATQERERLMKIRDDHIRLALNDGLTWLEIQRITGLGPNGIAVALKRSTSESAEN